MFILYLQKLLGMPQYNFKYKDKNFETEIITQDRNYLENIVNNLFNQQSVSKENEALRKQLDDFVSGRVIPPILQAQIDEATGKVKANTEKLKDAEEDNQQS
jgi:hypothetical protein